MRETKQKDIILKTVMASCDHPTAETIYQRAKTQLPKISLATVYRNLASLSEAGKIKRIALSTCDRFDKTVEEHSHFYCTECGHVFDLDFDKVQELVDHTITTSGCKIEKIDILFAGKCKDCINKNNR